MKKIFLIVLATAILMSGQALAGPAGSYDTASWMGDIYQGREATQLRDIVIPGTHDSGTYNFSSSSDVAPGQPGYYELAKGIVADWGRTHSYNIYDQLQRGIRYFDLRINKHEGEFVMVHGLVGMKLIDILAQVKQFSDEHPKEIILLEFANTPADADMPAMLAMIDQYVGDRMPHDNSQGMATLTLAELWEDDPIDGKNNNIISATCDSLGIQHGLFETCNGITGGFANTTSSGPLYNHNKNLLISWHSGSRDSLLYTAFTYTPQTEDIVNDVFDFTSSGSLLGWTQNYLRSYIGEWLPEWEQEGLRPNIIASDFFEYTAAVPEALRMNSVAPAVPANLLEVTRVDKVDLRWTDRGSGSDNDGAVWRPRAVAGYYPLADIPTSGYQFDWNVDTYLVKGDQPGVTKPLGFNWVWNDNDSGSDEDISIWRPIAPASYVCMGDVVTNNYDLAPSTDCIRCVHESYLEASPNVNHKWNDLGSGGQYDVSLWDGHNPDGTTLNIGALRANRSYTAPAAGLFNLIRKDKIQDNTACKSVSDSWISSGGRYPNHSGNISYILTIEPGQSVTIDLTSNIDTYLYIVEMDGSWQSSNDDGGDGYNSRLSYSSVGSAQYRLIAATYSSGQAGDFTLSVSNGSLEKE